VGAFSDESVNCTLSGAVPDTVVAVNDATGVDALTATAMDNSPMKAMKKRDRLCGFIRSGPEIVPVYVQSMFPSAQLTYLGQGPVAGSFFPWLPPARTLSILLKRHWFYSICFFFPGFAGPVFPVH
jgi:hypothetical protein